jgi:hypothetical protein
MRRISIGMMLLVLMPGITQADRFVPLHCRVQYNPYAFGYHSNGLVPGGIVYSPYAFRPGNPGLVFEGVRYDPYAFNGKGPGLVLDYYWYPIPYAEYNVTCSPDAAYAMYRGAASGASGGPTYMGNCQWYGQYSRATVSPAPTPRPVASADKEDPLFVIRQHLRGQGFTDVGINRTLRVENKLISADFTVGGRNLLIKYWDPTQVGQDAKAAPGQKAIEKYRKDWEAFASKYQQDGGEIYVVAASGRTDIVAALNACKSLNPGGAKPGEQVMVAKQ